MEREMRGMNKIVIVSQKTRLQELIERFNTKEQAQFYIEHMGDSFDDYLDEDRCYAESLTYVRKKAEQYARVSVIDKSFLCNYIFGRDDLVVCVGRDGLVCNTMKYLEESNLVIGINPDPSRSFQMGRRYFTIFGGGFEVAFCNHIRRFERGDNEKNNICSCSYSERAGAICSQ